MSRQISFRFACLVALLCLTTTQPASARVMPDDLPAYILPAHRAVLEAWLKENPNLRPAIEADADQDELKQARDSYTGKSFQAFYAVADFNQDGQEDFAIGLINKDKPDSLVIAVFNGPFKKGKVAPSPAYYNDTKFDRSAFLTILLGDNWNRLMIGQGSDSSTVVLKPAGKGYYIWSGAGQ